MIYVAVIICLILAFFLISCCGKSKTCDKSSEAKIIEVDEDVSIISNDFQPLYSKKQIELMLRKLAVTPPPTDLAMGAMCYSPTMYETSNIDYICSVCGEKTIYLTDYDNYHLSSELQYGISSARREIKKIKGVNIKLDETQFCSHCRTQEVDIPSLGLWINIGGERDTSKVYGVTYRDLQLLNEFFSGNLKYKDDYDFEQPLINRLDRLEQLLGVKIRE